MENQNELEIGIGTETAISLKPFNVVVKEVAVELVGEKKAKKVVCSCYHPEAESLIKISQVKWENKGKLEVSGLWFNVDSKGLIRKGSALATFLQANGAANLTQLVGKSIPTILDDKNYLAFKGY